MFRVFMISGEDPGADIDTLCRAVEHATGVGLQVMLGFGVLPEPAYRALRQAGAELYALKFETSNPEIFACMKPDTSLERRLEAIQQVRAVGMRLGSGNIVGLPGESVDDLARDIRLMVDLEIDWAPIVPYLPSPATPLGQTQPMGSVDLLLREISLLRLQLPEVLITAGQPSQDSALGFADPEGTKDALLAGANLLFVDLTPRGRQEEPRHHASANPSANGGNRRHTGRARPRAGVGGCAGAQCIEDHPKRWLDAVTLAHVPMVELLIRLPLRIVLVHTGTDETAVQISPRCWNRSGTSWQTSWALCSVRSGKSAIATPG